MKVPFGSRTWNIGISVVTNLAAIYARITFAAPSISVPSLLIEIGLLMTSVVYFARKKYTEGFLTTTGHILVVALLGLGFGKNGYPNFSLAPFFLAPFMLFLMLFDVELIKGKRHYLVLAFLACATPLMFVYLGS